MSAPLSAHRHPQPPAPPGAKPVRPALWLALYLPALPLEAWAATLQPQQRQGPLALLAGARLSAINAQAASLGLQPGMKRATALALAPHTVLGQADAAREAQALQALGYAALDVTPSVTLHGAATLLLEVSTTQRLFGGLPGLITHLQQATANWGFSQRLASAPTAGGARLLAHWMGHSIPSIGEHTLSLQVLQRQLDAAPLSLLEAAGPHLDSFQLMGVSSLADLRQLPRDGVARRFGTAVLTELDAARGEVPQAHAWLTLPAAFEARLELFARADTTEQVLYGAQMLLQRLVAWARASRGRVRRLQLAMLHEPRHRRDDSTPARSTLELALAEPSNDTQHIGVLLRERLAHTPLPAPTLELRMACADLAFSDAPSGELFPTRASEQEGLLRLVERLQARLGREAVRGVQAVADHRPERSTRLVPLQAGAWLAAAGHHRAQGADPEKTAGASSVNTPAISRPVWIFPQPQVLSTRQSAPWLDGHPLQVLAGPQRIETGWWDGELVVRDYFVAQAHDQSLIWIYRTRLPAEDSETTDVSGRLAAGAWFLHGRFA